MTESHPIPHLCFEWAEESYPDLCLAMKHLEALGFKEFAIQNLDPYCVKPSDSEYQSYESSKLHTLVVPERKNLWGMIWTRCSDTI